MFIAFLLLTIFLPIVYITVVMYFDIKVYMYVGIQDNLA